MSAQLKQPLDEQYTGYTLEDHQRAFNQFQVHGNLKQVERNTGIPRSTLRDWQHSEWWLAEATRVRQETDARNDVELSRLLDLALAELYDRITQGDHKVLKDGSIIRVPMDGKAMAVCAAIIFDKRQIARSLPTHITASTGQLDALADNLKRLQREGMHPSVKPS